MRYKKNQKVEYQDKEYIISDIRKGEYILRSLVNPILDIDVPVERVIYINGYWIDTEERFEGYKCLVGGLGYQEDDDDEEDIFYFFDDMSAVERHKKTKNNPQPGDGDGFVITKIAKE